MNEKVRTRIFNKFRTLKRGSAAGSCRRSQEELNAGAAHEISLGIPWLRPQHPAAPPRFSARKFFLKNPWPNFFIHSNEKSGLFRHFLLQARIKTVLEVTTRSHNRAPPNFPCCFFSESLNFSFGRFRKSAVVSRVNYTVHSIGGNNQ